MKEICDFSMTWDDQTREKEFHDKMDKAFEELKAEFPELAGMRLEVTSLMHQKYKKLRMNWLNGRTRALRKGSIIIILPHYYAAKVLQHSFFIRTIERR